MIKSIVHSAYGGSSQPWQLLLALLDAALELINLCKKLELSLKCDIRHVQVIYCNSALHWEEMPVIVSHFMWQLENDDTGSFQIRLGMKIKHLLIHFDTITSVFIIIMDLKRNENAACPPAVERPVFGSVCLFPSAPAVSAADGVLLSAYSSHPAGHTETPPACGPQCVSLHHCYTHLVDINNNHKQQNNSILPSLDPYSY